MFIVFQLTTLLYSQTIYFTAMNPVEATDDAAPTPDDETLHCRNKSPQIFYWLMFNILIFYVFFMISVCFFFRKYCQDHSLVVDQLKHEKEEHDMKKKHDEEAAIRA